MSDTPDTGQHRAQTLDDRVIALEACERTALVERTSISTSLRNAMILVTFSAAGIVGGAVSVYSKSLTTEQRVSVVEGRSNALEAAAQRRESDDRAQRDQSAETRSDVRAIRVQLDEILRRLQRAEDDRTPVPSHR